MSIQAIAVEGLRKLTDGELIVDAVNGRVDGFEVLYPVNEVATKHDASVLEETSSPDEAYARWGKEERSSYGEGWLPS